MILVFGKVHKGARTRSWNGNKRTKTASGNSWTEREFCDLQVRNALSGQWQKRLPAGRCGPAFAANGITKTTKVQTSVLTKRSILAMAGGQVNYKKYRCSMNWLVAWDLERVHRKRSRFGIKFVEKTLEKQVVTNRTSWVGRRMSTLRRVVLWGSSQVSNRLFASWDQILYHSGR